MSALTPKTIVNSSCAFVACVKPYCLLPDVNPLIKEHRVRERNFMEAAQSPQNPWSLPPGCNETRALCNGLLI